MLSGIIPRIASIILILTCSLPLGSQTKSAVFTDPKSFLKPKLEVEGSTTYDFGNIYRGQTVTHVFTLKNEGSDTLVISNVTSSCGCTAALTSLNRVPPRSKTELKVTFNSEGFSGKVVKVATVFSNDPENPAQSVWILANVRQILEANPSTIYFGRAKVDSLSSTIIKLTNVTDRTITILSTESKHRDLQLEIPKKSIKPGETVDLKAIFKLKKEGMVFADVVLKTDFQIQPTVALRMTSNVFR